MNIFIKLVLLGAILTVISPLGGTYSYFSDVECSEDNTITMGTWDNQADFLEIDHSKAKLTGNQEKLFKVYFKNTGDEELIIDRMQVGWNIANVDPNHLLLINAHGMKSHLDDDDCLFCDGDDRCLHYDNADDRVLFLGCYPSGKMIDCDDFALCGNSSSEILFRFDGDVSGSFLITIIMEDGSSKNVCFDVVK